MYLLQTKILHILFIICKTLVINTDKRIKLIYNKNLNTANIKTFLPDLCLKLKPKKIQKKDLL